MKRQSVKKVKIEDTVPKNSTFEDIVITKTSNIPVNVTTDTTGNYIIMVSDITPGGSNAIFMCSKSIASVESVVSIMSSSRGIEGQRLNCTWLPNETVKMYHHIVGSGDGNYTYRVKVYSGI